MQRIVHATGHSPTRGHRLTIMWLSNISLIKYMTTTVEPAGCSTTTQRESDQNCMGQMLLLQAIHFVLIWHVLLHKVHS